MDLRTRIKIDKYPSSITYTDPVIFLGSCFASEIGSKFAEGKMPVLINPAGTVFNPVSVNKTLDLLISGVHFTEKDLYNHDGTWLSFAHYTDFSDKDPLKALKKINISISSANEFLRSARYLFITFGTARVFRFKKSGAIVSNCHKLPASEFVRELLRVEDIVSIWDDKLRDLKKAFPELKVIFTVSPVRHWKDGAHGNQVSKSVLFLAIEELLRHPSKPGYFPAYEILMDELRDYRFYAGDMIHPSTVAVDYIWEKFTDCFFSEPTVKIWNEVSKITRAMNHRIGTSNPAGIKKFADNMLEFINKMEATVSFVDLAQEKEYFKSLTR